eukprot:CAMPEP_0115121610 /NCGR_PEP_ID=MMETSP0227-20121206/46343_1 /TAXON_ID=89957 /ORGANISM="Polarella glacialis, Strain CCMP 1383" /LENGTH=33 /DNA_ID= /DNA_START= /DNA_END= /DNA_ORIENTATION=
MKLSAEILPDPSPKTSKRPCMSDASISMALRND